MGAVPRGAAGVNADPYACAHCGASLSLEQLRGQNCPFCGTVFPHHGRAVEQAALVNQVMASQVQQAHQMMASHAQRWGLGGPGPQVQVQYGAPQVQVQYGGAPPEPYNPYGDLHQQAEQAKSSATKLVMIIVVVSVVLPIVIGVVFAVLMLAPF